MAVFKTSGVALAGRARDEKGFSKNVKWMERINELRRIPAHPAKERRYKVEDFEYINFIYDEFMRRINECKEDPDLDVVASESESDE